MPYGYMLFVSLHNLTILLLFVVLDMEMFLNVPEGSSSLHIRKKFNTDHILGKMLLSTGSISFNTEKCFFRLS